MKIPVASGRGRTDLVVFYRAMIFVAFVCVTLIGMTAWQILDSRPRALESADVVLENLAESLSLHAQSAFSQADTVMRDLAERIQVDGTQPAQLSRLRKVMRDAVEEHQQIDDFFYLDAAGHWIAEGHARAAPVEALKELIEYHRQHDDFGSHIGQPDRIQSTGAWTIPLSRRVNDVDGHFSGVLVAAINNDYFHRYYGRFELGESGLIAMHTTDGTVVAEQSDRKKSLIGLSLKDSALFKNYFSSGFAGLVTADSPVDGIKRHYAYRSLSWYPLQVVVSSSENHILAEWRRSATIDLTVTSGLLLFIALGGLSLLRQVRQRARSENSLSKSLQAVKNLEHAMDQHALVSVTDTHGKILRANDRFCAVSRYSREQLLGRDHAVLNSGVHSDTFFVGIRKTLAAGNVWRGEICNRTREGNLYWVRATIVPFFDESGQIYQYVSIGTEITERKAAESALIEARHVLEENNRKLADLVHLDGLTGIANRRRFDRVMDVEFRRALRSGRALSLLMIDVDLFKQFNDLYGHVAGDECLKLVARAIQSSQQRAGDLVARYGGEEFVVVLPHTDADGAYTVAEKIRLEVAALQIAHDQSVHGRVTVSIGVHTMVPVLDGDGLEELIRLADVSLYEAKRDGRNRVRSVAHDEAEQRL